MELGSLGFRPYFGLGPALFFVQAVCGLGGIRV